MSDKNENYRNPQPIIPSVSTEGDPYESMLDVSILDECNSDIEYRHTGLSEEQFEDLKVLKKFHVDSMVIIEEYMTKGVSYREFPKRPKKTLEQIIGKKNIHKQLSKSSKNESKRSKSELKDMNSRDFNSYLKQFLPANTNTNKESNKDKQKEQTVMPTDDVNEMGVYIKNFYIEAEKDKTLLLKKKLQLGKYLIQAKARYSHFKVQTKCRDTWSRWLLTQTGINSETAKQYMRIAGLVTDYPKLGDLQITFNDLRNMEKKIKSVFIENQDIKKQWQKTTLTLS